MSVTSSQFGLLAKLLDVASLRHQVIAQNVANVNTPGYRRLEVSFESALAEKLGDGEAGVATLVPSVAEGSGGTMRDDGNNVDIDAEMGRLNKNAVLFNVYAQILATKIGAMRSAIAGR